jgi:hypothetical protein
MLFQKESRVFALETFLAIKMYGMASTPLVEGVCKQGGHVVFSA